MIKDLKKVKDKVSYLLEKYPSLRDNDKKLWLSYMNAFHEFRCSIETSQFPYLKMKEILLSKDTPSLESIRRTRQKIQERGFYLGKNRTARLKESSKVKQWTREY